MASMDGVEPLIGSTPLVRLGRLFPPPGPRVLLKMEQFNPGGSVKDRTALGMLRHEEQADRLRPGMTIVESSSGNTAIGLSILSKERGYRVVAVCDRHLPAGKRSRLRALAADIVFLPDTPPGLDTVQLRIAVANYLAYQSDDAISLGQYSHPGNLAIHRATTGPEIWEDLHGDVAAIVVAVGTCGTISGVGQFIKSVAPEVEVVGVEPQGSIIFGGCAGKYLIQGGGLDFVPPILDLSVIDEGIKVTDAEAIAALHHAGDADGWMLGGTAGLVLAAIARIRPRYTAQATIVGIVPDGGDRYIDTVYDPGWLASHGLRARAGDGMHPGGNNRCGPAVGPGSWGPVTRAPLSPPLVDAVREMQCSINQFDPAGDNGTLMHRLCDMLKVAPAGVVPA